MRADLLALTSEALAALANVGLVKRAQRELAGGTTPNLDEQADGTVVGTFADGAITRLPAATPLKECACSCGATAVCRHRVAVVLAYQASQGSASASQAAPAAAVPWSPGELADELLERTLGAKVVERARAQLRGPLLVTVERGAIPLAILPSCTVRFLVPGEIAHAKCDCALAGRGCEHIALAVWSFRKAPRDTLSAVVSVGQERNELELGGAVLDEALAFARDLLVAGVAAGPPSPVRFATLRTGLRSAGMTWLHNVVVDLEIALEGYHRRSAIHDTREIAGLLVELVGRVRAARSPAAALPARFVLGEDEAAETRLDHVRLISLGARVRPDERTRVVDVFLADPDTSTVLVLQKRWDFGPDEAPEDGPALARRALAPGVSLKALAHGQVVSKVVSRHANRAIELARARGGQTSVAPQRGDFASLPAPLCIRDLTAHAARVRAMPPRLLRPRILAEGVHVVEVSRVEDVVYAAAEQTLHATLCDAAGQPFELVAQHRSVAPHGLDAVAAALLGGVRFVVGELTCAASSFRLDVLSLAAESFVVPDLAGPAPPRSVRSGAARAAADPLDAALMAAESVVDELCNLGLRSPPRTTLARARAHAAQLELVGAAELASRLGGVAAAAEAGEPQAAAAAWLEVALRLALARELHAQRVAGAYPAA